MKPCRCTRAILLPKVDLISFFNMLPKYWNQNLSMMMQKRSRRLRVLCRYVLLHNYLSEKTPWQVPMSQHQFWLVELNLLICSRFAESHNFVKSSKPHLNHKYLMCSVPLSKISSTGISSFPIIMNHEPRLHTIYCFLVHTCLWA